MRLRSTSKGICAGAALALLVASTQICFAAPIVYTVNRVIGAGTVTGTIETDGTLGILGTANIIAWNLQLNGLLGSSFNLTQANSVDVVNGLDLSATANDLLFNFAAADDGYFLIQATSPGLGSGWHYYCDAASLQNFWCAPGETVDPLSVFDNPQTYQYAARATEPNPIVIGTAGGGSAPEPATLLLLAIGVAGLALHRRKTDAH